MNRKGIHALYIVLMLGLILAPLSVVPAQDGIAVNEIAICKQIEDRMPVDADTAFTADVGQLYCFTAFGNPDSAQTIQHVWLYGDKEMARIDLKVGQSKHWRVWSSKRIQPEWTGTWQVKVMDQNGNELKAVDFMVK